MAKTVCMILSAFDRERLAAIAADRNRLRKHAERARVVLPSASGNPVQRVATQLGLSRPMVWRWQQRSAEEGVDSLLHDKTRQPGKLPIPAETVARVVAVTCTAPPHAATRRTYAPGSAATRHPRRGGSPAHPRSRVSPRAGRDEAYS